MCKFKEVQCPRCEHVFAWLTVPYGCSYDLYRRKGFKEELFIAICPSCSLEMVVPDESHVGIDVQDDTIEHFATLRGI